MIAWMAYWVVLSAGLGIAALAVERAVHLYGRPSRGVWAALLGVISIAPIALWLRPLPTGGGDVGLAMPLSDVAPGMPIGTVSGSATLPAAGVPLDDLLLVLWIAASVAVLAFLAISALRLARARRTWPRRPIDGRELHIAPATGPAVVGLIRPAIVLPTWIAEGDADARRLVLDHEEEHLRAGDGRLLLIALAAVVLVPWNPVAWWGLRRLRLAVEMDCDARVLARGHHPRRYAELLLQVGRQGGAMPLAVAISEPKSQLERRIIMFTRPTPGNRLARATAVGAVAIAVPVAAWALPAPSAPERPALELRGSAADAPDGLGAITVRPMPADTPVVHPQAGDVSREPAFTPYNVSPELRNRQEFAGLLQRRYPAELRDAGVGGTVLLHVLIDDEGVVRETRVMEGSGQGALDAAAEEVMREARFSPARLDDVRVPVWIQLPVTFRTDGGAAAEQRRETPEAAPRRETRPAPPPIEDERAPEDRPAFTPFTQAPELRNREEFSEVLRNRYPEGLREAGVGGRVLLHVFIDTEGRVANTRVMESSGYPVLDQAAEEVMREARFSPARNRDEVVPVWIQLPVSFRAPSADG